VQWRLTFTGVAAEEILPTPCRRDERIDGGRATEMHGFLFASKDVGAFVSAVCQRFVHLAEQGALGFRVTLELTGKAFFFGDPSGNGFPVPWSLPLVIIEVLRYPPPQALIRRGLRTLLAATLTVVFASASTVSPSRHGEGFG
jgi:hypothetical protein